jgi:tRNA threonylcarbamoyladenosine biosynthesis protein TsaE
MPLLVSLPTAVRVTLPALVEFGEALGRSLTPPHLVALSGDLGAGKTTLIQAICRGYGVTSDVTSPTFALVHVYNAPRSPVFHLDLYRLRDAAELTNIGWDDIMNERAIILVEWPERAGVRLPTARTHLYLDHVTGDADIRSLHLAVP